MFPLGGPTLSVAADVFELHLATKYAARYAYVKASSNRRRATATGQESDSAALLSTVETLELLKRFTSCAKRATIDAGEAKRLMQDAVHVAAPLDDEACNVASGLPLSKVSYSWEDVVQMATRAKAQATSSSAHATLSESTAAYLNVSTGTSPVLSSLELLEQQAVDHRATATALPRTPSHAPASDGDGDVGGGSPLQPVASDSGPPASQPAASQRWDNMAHTVWHLLAAEAGYDDWLSEPIPLLPTDVVTAWMAGMIPSQPKLSARHAAQVRMLVAESISFEEFVPMVFQPLRAFLLKEPKPKSINKSLSIGQPTATLSPPRSANDVSAAASNNKNATVPSASAAAPAATGCDHYHRAVSPTSSNTPVATVLSILRSEETGSNRRDAHSVKSSVAAITERRARSSKICDWVVEGPMAYFKVKECPLQSGDLWHLESLHVPHIQHFVSRMRRALRQGNPVTSNVGSTAMPAASSPARQQRFSRLALGMIHCVERALDILVRHRDGCDKCQWLADAQARELQTYGEEGCSNREQLRSQRRQRRLRHVLHDEPRLIGRHTAQDRNTTARRHVAVPLQQVKPPTDSSARHPRPPAARAQHGSVSASRPAPPTAPPVTSVSERRHGRQAPSLSALKNPPPALTAAASSPRARRDTTRLDVGNTTLFLRNIFSRARDADLL